MEQKEIVGCRLEMKMENGFNFNWILGYHDAAVNIEEETVVILTHGRSPEGAVIQKWKTTEPIIFDFLLWKVCMSMDG